MPYHVSRYRPWCLLLTLGLAVYQNASASELDMYVQALPTHLEVEAVAWLPALDTLKADRALISDEEGLLLLAPNGQIEARQAGRYEGLDTRTLGAGVVIATYDKAQDAPALLVRNGNQWESPQVLPTMDFTVSALCLYRDDVQNLFVFLAGQGGQGVQYLVGYGDRLLPAAREVRQLGMPANVTTCSVDDQAGVLYVNEETVGVWAYEAHPEARFERRPVDLVKPFGSLAKSAGAVAAVPGGVLVMNPKANVLHRYAYDGQAWQPQPPLAVRGEGTVDQLSARPQGDRVALLMRDDDRDGLLAGTLAGANHVESISHDPIVLPSGQTEEVGRHGDAADDPAIWVSSHEATHSRVLGTDKQYGLIVYDLQGRMLQRLPSGLLNNVDIRPGFKWGNERVDLAVASNRTDNSLTLFSIDPATGNVAEIGRVPTPLKEVYGFCLYAPAPGDIQAIVNDKDGTFLQYRLSGTGGQVRGEMLRQFRVGSQPEGCVADDRHHRLFVGEEDVAVWTLTADPFTPAALEPVIRAGEGVQADIEGLALYRSDQHDYLIVSSQGNNRYVVLDAQAPYRLRGTFQVGLDAEAGIDGTSETDGLEVTSADLGGAYSQGMLVVQDGYKRLPEGTQNFKYVPWSRISQALKLP
ncbi:3-phytase [Pseudomonas duriflava]|uniref:3-phytase n=1 Tax=Pseudomonas duriflava TaxID=459528 RepID=A0A562Q932_9PSED|nr:phytase [Pseudomonas duriflava]TWI52536.1 3-phytase [Pseudomonas duriflava]